MNTRLFIIIDNSNTSLIQQGNDAYTVEIDLFDDIEIPMTLQVADVKDITKKNSSFSKTFEIPASSKNRRILEALDMSSFVADQYGYDSVLLERKYNCIIKKWSRDIFYGILNVVSVNRENEKIVSYSCNCTSHISSFFEQISNKTFLGNEVWGDLNNSQWNVPSGGMTPARFSSLYCYNSNTGTFELPAFSNHFGYAAIDRFYKAGEEPKYVSGIPYTEWRSYELTPYVYISDILDKIIRNTGYNWVSEFFGHTLDVTNPWDESRSWLTSRSSEVLKNIEKFNTFEMVMPQCTYSNTPSEYAHLRHYPVSHYSSPGQRTDDDITFYRKSYTNVNGYKRIYTFNDSGYFWDLTSSSVDYESIPTNLTDQYAKCNVQQQGWYRINFNFHWQMIGRFYDADGITTIPNTGVRYRLDNTIGDYEDGSYVAYDIMADIIKESNGTTTILKRIYQNINSGKSLAQYLTGFNRRLGHTDASGDILLASSQEFDEANGSVEDGDKVGVSDYGLTYNKPVEGEIDTFLLAGDKISIRFRCAIRTGTDDSYFNTAYETYGDARCRLHSIIFKMGQSYNNGNLFSMTRLDSVGPYNSLNWNNIIPPDMKQIDFVQTLCRMFNLYIEDVSLKPNYYSVWPSGIDSYFKYPVNTLRIEPRDLYYERKMRGYPPPAYVKKDWSDKVDMQTVKITMPSDYINRNISFNYKEDSSDFMVGTYNGKYDEKLGSETYKSVYNSDEADSIELSVAASEYGEVIPGGGSEVMYGFSVNNGVVDTSKSLTPRIMFRCLSQVNSGDRRLYTQIGNLVNLTSSYATLSNYRWDSSARNNSIADLSFGLPKYSMMKSSRNSNVTTNNLFNAFYYNELNNIASVNSRMMTCEAYLTPTDIENLQLSDEIIINSVVYHINSIKDWKNENEPCTCEFIKILPDVVPSPSTTQVRSDNVWSVGIITKDSSGNVTINNNTVNINTGGGGGGSYSLGQVRENIHLVSGGQIVSTVTVPDMVGATSAVSGLNGLVPQPLNTDKDKFLKGDGTWGNDSYTLDSLDGISVSLYRNGSIIDTVPIETFLGADAQNAGTPGLVPTAQTGDRTKFLRGDGTWANGSGGNTYSIRNNPTTPSTIELLENGVVTSDANVPEYEGCTQLYPGEYGMIHPAPAGGMDYYFSGDGVWKPIPSGGYILRFTLHSGLYTLDEGSYSGAVNALRSGKPVFAILTDEDASQDGDEILYTLSHFYVEDSYMIFSKKELSSSNEFLELYDDDSFDFYSSPIRNFGRLKVDSNTTYQTSAPDAILTLRSGTGITLSQSNATVTFNLETATSGTIGGIKVSSTQAPNAGTMATSGMRRPVQIDANGNASVLCDNHVAGDGLSLINNAFTLNQATSSVLGGIKVSSTSLSVADTPASSGEIYPVQISSSGLAGVMIPAYEATWPAKMVDKNIGICPSDATETSYRVGNGFCDIYGKEYTKYAGTVTPVSSIYIDRDDGTAAIKEWENFTTLEDYTGRVILSYPNSRTDDLFALPITVIRTFRGSVPVVLVNGDIMQLLGRAYSTGPNKLDCVPYRVS